MSQVLESEWGQEPLTVGSQIPTVALRLLLGRVHVMTADEEIERMIGERIDRGNGTGGRLFTPEEREQTIAAGLWLHHENRAEYIGVMSGRF